MVLYWAVIFINPKNPFPDRQKRTRGNPRVRFFVTSYDWNRRPLEPPPFCLRHEAAAPAKARRGTCEEKVEQGSEDAPPKEAGGHKKTDTIPQKG